MDGRLQPPELVLEAEPPGQCVPGLEPWNELLMPEKIAVARWSAGNGRRVHVPLTCRFLGRNSSCTPRPLVPSDPPSGLVKNAWPRSEQRLRIARQIIVLIEYDANRLCFTLDEAQRHVCPCHSACDSAQRASHKSAQGNALGYWFSSTKRPNGATLN